MKRLAAALAVLALVGDAGPGRAEQPGQSGQAALEFLHVGAVAGPGALPQVLDEDDRQVLLRGVDLNGLVDYWTPDLRPPYPPTADAYAHGACPADSPATTAVPLCERDLDQVAALGLDVVRLPVSWSLLEPAPGHLDPAAFDRVAQVVRWSGARGVRVVLDLHQDAWSKFVTAPAGSTCPPGSDPADGGDGAPAWASEHVSPVCAQGGTRELDPAVQEAAQRFWSDLPAPDGVGLQEHYAHVVTALAARFASEPAVAGYEVMNEPQPGLLPGAMDPTELMAFQGRVVDATVAAVPGFRQLFFVEPGGTRNVTAARTSVVPWSTYSAYPDVVYAPHVYTGVFTADTTLLQGRAGTVQSSDSDYAAAAGDARALGLPLWVGEFGDDLRDDRRLLDPQYAHQDALGAGGALWVWKEHGSWGAYAPPYDDGGTPRTDRVTRLSTLYPQAVAGDLTHLTSDPFAGTAEVSGTTSGPQSAPTVLSVPAPFDLGRAVVTGARWRTRVVHGQRQVLLSPRGGPWSFRVV